MAPAARQQSQIIMDQLVQNINQLEPVLTKSDEEFTDFKQHEEEITRLLPNIKGYLQIEKIKLELGQID